MCSFIIAAAASFFILIGAAMTALASLAAAISRTSLAATAALAESLKAASAASLAFLDSWASYFVCLFNCIDFSHRSECLVCSDL